MLSILIVDDEQPVRQLLEGTINNYCNDCKVVATADSVQSAAEKTVELKPDLILLDINLPDGTGFDLLEKIQEDSIKVIFITAYDEFAVKAFRFSAVDYLVKPVDIDELQTAIQKVKDQKEKDDLGNKLKVLVQNMNSSNADEKKIVLKTHESIHIVKVAEITHCVADQNYTEFYLTGKRKLLVSRTLKEFEEMLSDYNFFRTHQSHLINMNYIRRFDKADGGELVLEDESHIPVSKRKRNELFELFDKL